MEFIETETITIEAAAPAVWSVLVDGACLPEWATMVRRTTGGIESIGAIRECEVVFGRRVEQVAERCVECVPGRRIAWQMTSGSMLKLYRYVGFGYTLEPITTASTLVTLGARYLTRNSALTVLHRLVMARRLASLRRMLLDNLATLVAQRVHDGPHVAVTDTASTQAGDSGT